MQLLIKNRSPNRDQSKTFEGVKGQRGEENALSNRGFKNKKKGRSSGGKKNSRKVSGREFRLKQGGEKGKCQGTPINCRFSWGGVKRA